MKLITTCCIIYGFAIILPRPCKDQGLLKKVSAHEMKVEWYHESDSVTFNITAPANGWMAIGFNQDDNIVGSYLLMTRVVAGHPQVEEYFSYAPGDYRKIQHNKKRVDLISCNEDFQNTSLSFSIPVSSDTDKIPSLRSGKYTYMHMAYSLSKKFDHHSIMRTSKYVQL